MANYVTDEGICLRVLDFSETSQIVGMLTRQHGLVPLIAKGSKRQSKKNVMSGPLDLLTSGEVVFVPPKESAGAQSGAQLGTLAAWELRDQRRDLRKNLAALNSAMLCAEITTHMLHPNDPHPELFGELEAALAILSEENPDNIGRVLVSYVKTALTSAGYWPRLEACLVCGRRAGDASMRFSARAGGVLCAADEKTGSKACSVGDAGVTQPVSGKVLLALERLAAPTVLRANTPTRAAEAAALLAAMHVLLSQVEAVTDKAVRTRYLLPAIFI